MKKILVVDDEADLREIIQFNIESLFENPVVLADNGANAIEQLKSTNDIGLIICDYSMPVQNGAVVFNHNKECQNIPFILLTGQELRDCKDISDFYESNRLNQVVKKPWQTDDFLDVIEKILNSSFE